MSEAAGTPVSEPANEAVPDPGTAAKDAQIKAMVAGVMSNPWLWTSFSNTGLSDFETGTEGKWNCSNTGYILLGLIIEKATGKSYGENLIMRIFEPLDLKHTSRDRHGYPLLIPFCLSISADSVNGC